MRTLCGKGYRRACLIGPAGPGKAQVFGMSCDLFTEPPGREVLLDADMFSHDKHGQLQISVTNRELEKLPAFDASRYYPLHPVEWQEEWGVVEGEILALYPPQDIDQKVRRRFIFGSLAIIGAIAASLAYPVFRLSVRCRHVLA